ncbi:MAG: DUF4369 domain-containing protein [Bacteroidales bacterium]|jgi:hypothetical protein|nr:DUF4369 domain-containing protein [Bacteroidales bacterium]
MIKDKTIIIFLAFIFFSCSHSLQHQAIITGQLKQGQGEKLVLTELEPKTIRKIDSTVLDAGGSFRFKVILTEPGFYMLHASSGKVLVLLLNLEDTVNLSGSFQGFPDQIKLNGPAQTKLLEDFFRFTRKNECAVDSLELLLVERQDSAGYFELSRKLDTVFKNIWDRQRAYELDFIDKHPSSLVSLIVLNYAFGLNTILAPEKDLTYFEKLDSVLTKSFPENKHVKYHHQRLMEFKRQKKTKENG